MAKSPAFPPFPAQLAQKLLIGLREGKPPEVAGPDPVKTLAGERLRFMLLPDAVVKPYAHSFFRVAVNDGMEEGSHRNFDSQFLPQFAL